MSNTIMWGLSVEIFGEGPALPSFEFPRAPSKIWRVPPLKYIANFGCPLGPQTKFPKSPIGFLGARGPYLRAPDKLPACR